MHFASSVRNFSLGLATAALALTGAAWARPAASTSQQSGQSAQSWHMVGANVRLEHSLSVTSAHQGQRIEARLSDTVKTANGMKIPRGTEIWGRVQSVHASTNGGPSSLSLVFTTAQMKNGHRIPVKVTVLGAYPSDEAQLAVTGSQTIPPAPSHINDQARIDQEAGLLSHISMHSAVQSSNSGTFRDSRGNLKLRTGTYLQVGIAPANSARG